MEYNHLSIYHFSKSSIFSYSIVILLSIIQGTPPQQNHPNLHLHQYLIPFKCQGKTDNYVLGHYLSKSTHGHTKKKHQGLIWGKEGRYYAPYTQLLAEISKFIPIVVMAKPDANAYLPDGVTNLGIVSQVSEENLLKRWDERRG